MFSIPVACIVSLQSTLNQLNITVYASFVKSQIYVPVNSTKVLTQLKYGADYAKWDWICETNCLHSKQNTIPYKFSGLVSLQLTTLLD